MIYLANILILISGILWGIELIPQIIRTYKLKDVSGVSFSFFLICWLAYILYIIGNVILNNWIIVIAHLPSMFMNLIMIALILKYR